MSAGPRVAILMGSISDLETMKAAAATLDQFGVPYRIDVTSAHRTPERTVEIVREAERQGVQVFIVGAGMAAHLAGAVAAQTTRPVLGVPMEGKLAGGLDALLSTVQMPRGIPVGTLAIGRSGAVNAALLACQVLALADEDLAWKLTQHREEMARGVEEASERLRKEVGGGD